MSVSTRLTVSHLFNVFKSLGPRKNVPLGRWKVCKNKNTGLIVDYSNIDHCGTCNYTEKNKSKLNNNISQSERYSKILRNRRPRFDKSRSHRLNRFFK